MRGSLFISALEKRQSSPLAGSFRHPVTFRLQTDQGSLNEELSFLDRILCHALKKEFRQKSCITYGTAIDRLYNSMLLPFRKLL